MTWSNLFPLDRLAIDDEFLSPHAILEKVIWSRTWIATEPGAERREDDTQGILLLESSKIKLEPTYFHHTSITRNVATEALMSIRLAIKLLVIVMVGKNLASHSGDHQCTVNKD